MLSVEGRIRCVDCRSRSVNAVNYRTYADVVAGCDVPAVVVVQVVVEVVRCCNFKSACRAAHCRNYVCTAYALRVVRVERVNRIVRVAADARVFVVGNYYIKLTTYGMATDINNSPGNSRRTYFEVLTVEGSIRRIDYRSSTTYCVCYRIYANVVVNCNVPAIVAMQIVIEVFRCAYFDTTMETCHNAFTAYSIRIIRIERIGYISRITTNTRIFVVANNNYERTA